jgi:hypothetical protein
MWRDLSLATAAPLLLAVVGVFHPHALTSATAPVWVGLHVALLPVFPLVTAGFVVPLWGRPRRDVAGFAAVLAWVAGFGYATFYTGLDAVAGIAAGTAAMHAPPGDVGPVVLPLFAAGDDLGRVGAYAFLVAVLAASVALYQRHGVRVLPGTLVLLVAGYSFIDSHIFWPRGVLTMLGFAVGFGLFVWAVRMANGGRPVSPPR